MASWALSLLRSTSKLLLSPAYFASDLFWVTLGYGPSSRQLLTAVAPVARVQASAPSFPTPSVSHEEVEGAHEMEMVPMELYCGGGPQGAAAGIIDEEQIDPEPSPRSLLDRSEPESDDTASLQSSDISQDSSPSADFHSPRPGPLFDRPLSLLLAQFSHRASVRLSSLELLDDEGPTESSRHSREPTVAQIAVVEQELERSQEIREVREAVEREVARMEKQVVPEAKEEETWFDRMGMVSSLTVAAEGELIPDAEQSFVDVSISSVGVDTEGWLKALESLLDFFETFAPAAASLAGADIKEDIRRIRAHYLTAPIECRTLELLAAHERPQRRKLATEALKWCSRGLKFVSLALRFSLDNPAEELAVPFTRAWEEEYSRYFSWVVRPLFKLLIRACPPREQLYQQLGSPRTKVERELGAYLDAIDEQVAMLEAAFKRL